MNISQLTIRDLEYLTTVGEALHFGKAAKILHVGQPTLSEQIKKLESHLNIVLFERTNRSVRLTPSGEELIKLAKDIILKAQEFVDYAKYIKEPMTGEFRLGAIATVGPYYFPYVLEKLKKAFPDLKLIIQEGHTSELLTYLDEGKLDAVIASKTFNIDRYRTYQLYFEPFLLATPNNFKINTIRNKVLLKEINRDQLILLTEGNCLKDEAMNLCSINNKKDGNKLQAASLETLRHLIAAGNGISLIPQLAITPNNRIDHLLHYYPIQDKNAGRNIILVTREQYPRPEQIRMLYKELKNSSPL